MLAAWIRVQIETSLESSNVCNFRYQFGVNVDALQICFGFDVLVVIVQQYRCVIHWGESDGRNAKLNNIK